MALVFNKSTILMNKHKNGGTVFYKKFYLELILLWNTPHRASNPLIFSPMCICTCYRGLLQCCPLCIAKNHHAAKYSKILNTFLFLFSIKLFVFRNACQNSKQERPWSDSFFRSRLIWVCAVCLDLFDRQLSLSVRNCAIILLRKGELVAIFWNCLPDVLWLLVFCGSSSQCRGLVVVFQDHTHLLFSLFLCFVVLRPKSTAIVMAGRSVHKTTLFPGQAWTSS